MKTLQFGMDHSLPDISQNTYITVASLAAFVGRVNPEISNQYQNLCEELDHLLAFVLECILFKDFDFGLIEPVSEALLALITCRKVNNICSFPCLLL